MLNRCLIMIRDIKLNKQLLAFICDEENQIDFDRIGMWEFVDEAFCREYGDKIKWDSAFRHIRFSQNFIREVLENYGGNLNRDVYFFIATNQNVSKKFLNEIKFELGWYFTSIYKDLDEQFIERWNEDVRWSNISQFSKLSNEFMRKYENKIDWEIALRYQDVDCVLRDRHKLNRRNSCCESAV